MEKAKKDEILLMNKGLFASSDLLFCSNSSINSLSIINNFFAYNEVVSSISFLASKETFSTINTFHNGQSERRVSDWARMSVQTSQFFCMFSFNYLFPSFLIDCPFLLLFSELDPKLQLCLFRISSSSWIYPGLFNLL